MILTLCLWGTVWMFAKSPSFDTYINPVIPGDHPDPTLTKIGTDFYSSGSSFNPTPKIYHSTDLVHWEVIAQPVSASWSTYGDDPGGGIWGGHMVYYHDLYWHYFGRGGGNMYFVTADQPEGPWSSPTRVQVPDGVPGLGVDNSIFIDDDGKWYMLTKAGQENNHIVELGEDGQPTGNVLDLTWLNPDDEGNPYGWAEGPVMWKYNGYYFYSFAQHLVGSQYVMRSETLTDDEDAWTVIGTNIFTGSPGFYNRPNHISPVVMLDDGTSWAVVHSYNSNASWYAQGRQGLLCQVTYDDDDFPVIQYPPNDAVPAPDLPSGGIPWAVARSDVFDTPALKPFWSHLGYTPDNTYSLTDREGWLHLIPYQGTNTVIQNDGEHDYTIITRVDFEPESVSDEAGLWIMNGPETHHAKVFSSVNTDGKKILAFGFQDILYELENRIGNTVWLKLQRSEHMMSGFGSADGKVWFPIGEPVDGVSLDREQTQFNDFTGSQQGLYITGKEAFFDVYIYKDAYTALTANSPANQYGTARKYSSGEGYVLGDIQNNDWAMYAGMDFGNSDYDKTPMRFKITASSNLNDSRVEVWLDSLDTGEKIADCPVGETGNSRTYETFTTEVAPVTGQHDVYLKFTGNESEDLLQLLTLQFVSEGDTVTSVPPKQGSVIPQRFSLEQNFPNPFNPATQIHFEIPENSYVSLKVFNLLGNEVAELAGKRLARGIHSVTFDASDLPNGIYTYTLQADNLTQTRKMLIIK